jgi:hypothetical protein
MRAYNFKVILLCATATLFAYLSSAEARYWRHYRYHWYGRTWNSSRPNYDERQIEKWTLGTEPGNDPRNQVGEFGVAIEQMIRACDGQVAELKNMPLDAVAGVVNPTPDQHDALDRIRSVALDASETLAAACPKNPSASLHERLETLGRTLDAMATSLTTLWPAFATFYGLLDDEQKARIITMTQPQSEEASRLRQSQDAAQNPSNSDGDLFCQRWVTYLKRWPIRQIEDRGHLSDDQRANLYYLTATIYRETARLGTVCHADNRLTPPGRLQARQQQLKAFAQSADAISPVFSRFEDDLTDPQKAQLREVLNLSASAAQRSLANNGMGQKSRH